LGEIRVFHHPLLPEQVGKGGVASPLRSFRSSAPQLVPNVGIRTWESAGERAPLACILIYIACFGLSVGPVTWVILSEIYPTAIRGRALGLATCFLWMADYGVTQTFPILDAKGSWFVKTFNHAFPFYVYAAFCAVLVAVVWRWTPETEGRSLEEIERAWCRDAT
jgi:hypothetical protein